MTHALVTIMAPLALGKVETVRGLIERLSDPANPAAGAIRDDVARGGHFLHFASMHALACSDGKAGVLVLEFSADGEERAAIDEVAVRIGARLQPILEESTAWRQGDQAAPFLRRHQVKVSQRLGGTVGLAFAGTPGMSVTDIRREDDLARHVAGLLASDGNDQIRSPLGRLRAVRDKLRDDSTWKWALEVPAPPLPAPGKEPGTLGKIGKLAIPGITTFLWPLLLVVLPLSLWFAWPAGWHILWPWHWCMCWPDWAKLIPAVAGSLVRFFV